MPAIPTDLEYIEGCGGMLIMYSKEFEVCPVEGWETVTRGDCTVDGGEYSPPSTVRGGEMRPASTHSGLRGRRPPQREQLTAAAAAAADTGGTAVQCSVLHCTALRQLSASHSGRRGIFPSVHCVVPSVHCFPPLHGAELNFLVGYNLTTDCGSGGPQCGGLLLYPTRNWLW